MEKPRPEIQPTIGELLKPIPSYEEARKKKKAYRNYPIDTVSEIFREGVFNIQEYGIAGQSYWSRPNDVFSSPIPEAPNAIYLRRSIIEILQKANYILSSPEITDYFRAPVELYVEDGLRTPVYQAVLYEDAFPRNIRLNNPNWTKEQVMARRDQLIAAPAVDYLQHPTPHMTGAAVDLDIRYVQPEKNFIEGVGIQLLRQNADPGISCNPDFAEDDQNASGYDEATWLEGKNNRRVFYNLMESLGMQVNPTEFWHWSYGDQMWALLRNQPAAFYGAVKKD
jgi:D-alanyl-D-alanine dipeptidase